MLNERYFRYKKIKSSLDGRFYNGVPLDKLAGFYLAFSAYSCCGPRILSKMKHNVITGRIINKVRKEFK